MTGDIALDCEDESEKNDLLYKANGIADCRMFVDAAVFEILRMFI